MAVRAPGGWIVAIAAAAAGCLVGGGGAALRAALLPWRIGEFVAVSEKVAADAPRVEVAETVYAFGTIATGVSGSHRFEIRNVGKRALTLSRGASSCSCTVSDFEASAGGSPDATKMVPPGESTFVTVRWQGKPPGGPFHQQVTILTDDPRRPEVVLAIDGNVVPTWMAVPESLALDQLTTSSRRRASTTIYTYGSEPPDVSAVVIDGPDADQFFSLTTTPLASDELAKQPGASGGFRIDLDIKPGLPIGLLRRTITAKFTMPDEVIAHLVVEGNVGSDLGLAGPGWDASRQTLVLGAVSGQAGFKWQLFVTAKGPHRDSVRPVVREVVPAGLQVKVGQGVALGSGNVVRFPVTLEVLPGARPANHLCSDQGPAGKIVFETGHPDAPTWSIPVCIAIGP